MDPRPRDRNRNRISARELWQLEPDDDRRYELDDGELIVVPPVGPVPGPTL